MRPSSHRSGGIWGQFKVRLQLAVAVEKIEGRKQTENSLKKVFDVEVGLTATRITPPLQNLPPWLHVVRKSFLSGPVRSRHKLAILPTPRSYRKFRAQSSSTNHFVTMSYRDL